VRLEALSGLQSADEGRAIAAVGGRVRDPDPLVRTRAVEVLQGLDAEFSAAYLLEACKDPDETVSSAAEAALLSQSPGAVAKVLARALGDPGHRRVARNLLSSLGAATVPELIAALPGVGDEVRATIGELLSEAGAEEQLLAEIEDRDPAKRKAALDGLAAVDASQHIDVIAQRLEDPVAAVRIRAAEILATIDDAGALEALKRAFVSDPDMDVVAAIEVALRKATGEPSAD
jgi:HEAT repeat protein